MLENIQLPKDIICENCKNPLKIKVVSDVVFIKPCKICINKLIKSTEIKSFRDTYNFMKNY